MGVHTKILKTFVDLGYKEQEIDDGVCHGISIRWLEAIMLNQEDTFNNRIQDIILHGDEIVRLMHAGEQEKWGDATKDYRARLLDIRAFFDSLALFLQPSKYAEYLGPLSQGHIETISTFASSDEIQDLGGLETIYSEPGIYTQEELEAYFSELEIIFDLSKLKEPIGMLLSSNEHTIAMAYIPADKRWKLMDINLMGLFGSDPSSRQFTGKQPAIMADNKPDIQLALNQTINIKLNKNKKTDVIFNTSILTTKNQSLIPLKHHLKSFKEKHAVTEEIASRAKDNDLLTFVAARNGHDNVITALGNHGVNLSPADKSGTTPAYIAAQNGHANVITALANHGGNLSHANKRGVTPAFIAAQCGHVSVIEALANHGADLKQVDENGKTPAYIAAQFGHANVIAALANHGTDLKQARPDGETPAYVAAQNGHVSVIAVLAKHKVNLNQADKSGSTPAFIAAQQGNANVIVALAKHKVNLNQARPDGKTPAYIAAQRGHANVITALANHEADLNQADKSGVTPAFIAAQLGRTDVIATLIKHGADFNFPFQSSGESLRKFAESHGPDVMTRMEAFIINRQLGDDNDSISMTPQMIAIVMGHEKIVHLLKQASFVKEAVENYFTDKANPSTFSEFKAFTSQIKQVEEEGVGVIWHAIKDDVATRMFDAFGSHYTNQDDPNFTALIHMGKDVGLEALPSFQRELSESEGYQAYCGSMTKSYRMLSQDQSQDAENSSSDDDTDTPEPS
ncbi:MAG: ankyrin repeat domain-containing protein [Legionella sp.]|nr:ankyrin repeat domain-containing protein [Legionella sp.]